MASNYTHLRCPGCDGTLKYKKEKKVWECIYCGNEIRREEQYDGLYTIKNVVKQVLVDLAYGRLDSARRNLIECEKISSDYVGTVIAGICVQVFTVITPGACQPNEIRGIYGQIKRKYDQLNAIDAGISSEEEALYEAMSSEQDAFGVLVLVFDTLKAMPHLEFVLELFDAAAVYSKDLNEKILNYAVKNQKTEMMDKIFRNTNNVDCKKALFSLLEYYEDGEQKRSYLPSLIKKAELRADDARLLEQYLISSNDSLETKILLYSEAVEYHVVPSIQSMQQTVLSNQNITEEEVHTVYQAFGLTHPKDPELYGLIDSIYTQHTGATANFEMQELLDSGLYIKLADKVIRVMLERRELSLEHRVGLLEKAQHCNLDRRERDNILAEILLENREDTDSRMVLLRKMLSYVETISTNVLTEYILNCNVDGDRKPEILEELLQLDLNMNYFQEVLNTYLQSGTDSEIVKERVARLLGNQGLTADGSTLLDMACHAGNDDYMNVVGCIQHAIQNGTRIEADYLSKYLERVNWNNYHKEIIILLDIPSAQISDLALANYVLYAPQDFGIKLQNVMELAKKNGRPFGTSKCEILHLNHRISCNLFQGYVLLTGDSDSIAQGITNAMKAEKAKLNAPMQVDGNLVKFKKYVVENKTKLSASTINLCEGNYVFSLFF